MVERGPPGGTGKRVRAGRPPATRAGTGGAESGRTSLLPFLLHIKVLCARSRKYRKRETGQGGRLPLSHQLGEMRGGREIEPLESPGTGSVAGTRHKGPLPERAH